MEQAVDPPKGVVDGVVHPIPRAGEAVVARFNGAEAPRRRVGAEELLRRPCRKIVVVGRLDDGERKRAEARKVCVNLHHGGLPWGR